MKIREAEPPRTSLFRTRRPAPAGRSQRLGGRTIFLLLAGAFFWGTVAGQHGIVRLDEAVQAVAAWPNRFLSALTSVFTPGPEHLVIDIGHTDFQRLAYARETALLIGRLLAKEEEFVPARITHRGTTYAVDLRLKGDYVDHLKGDKWSFRVEVEDDAALLGYRVFSIQDPATRNGAAEWTYQRALAREDIIGLGYTFVRVTLNGKDLGIFALEEHFDTPLIERHRRREGPIVRFSEEPLWAQWDALGALPQLKPLTSAAFAAAPIDGFQTNRLAADSVQFRLFRQAAGLLNAFQEGIRHAGEVFDVRRMADYLALSEVMGATHGPQWHHMRFYFNPITARLEPIGFDGVAGHPVTSLWLAARSTSSALDYADGFQRLAFRDSTLFAAYVRALDRFSSPAYLDSLHAELGPELETVLRTLRLDDPGNTYPRAVFEANQRLIRTVLRPALGLQVHLREIRAAHIRLDAGSAQFLPIEVLGLALDDSLIAEPTAPIRLPGRREAEPVSFAPVDLALPATAVVFPADSLLARLSVRYRVAGTSAVLEAPIARFPSPTPALDDAPTGRSSNTHMFPFLQEESAGQRVVLPAGRWTIDHPMILPAGSTFVLEAGAEVELRGRAYILARGPVQAIGRPEAPIRILSRDGTGGGLVVLGTRERSRLEHVYFEGLGAVTDGGWMQTGAVVFHEAPVDLVRVAFTRNRSEDALNIVRTSFTMTEIDFREIHADAFDADFTEGWIEGGSFEGLGNDAIDVSGSTVTVRGTTIRGAGDKALSAGEHSALETDRVSILDVEIAVASKDRSSVVLRNSEIDGARLGFAVFQKKSEFGPARVEASGLTLHRLGTPWLVEAGSALLLNDTLRTPNSERVGDLLYGNRFGKASE